MNQKHIDLAIDSLVEGNLAEALGHLMLFKLEFAKQIAEAPKVDPLPPMIPIKPGKARSIDVKCPTCGAKPGRPCMRLTSRGQHGKPTDQPLVDGEGTAMYHKTRYAAAKEASS